MKTILLVTIAAFAIIGVTLAISTKEAGFNKIFDRYAFIVNTVDNVLVCDSLFKSLSAAYKKRQAEQYNIYMQQGNFNTPVPKWICDEIFSDLKLKSDDKKHFVISIFRMSVMFKIVDELKDGQLPTKEKIVNDFTMKYHFQ